VSKKENIKPMRRKSLNLLTPREEEILKLLATEGLNAVGISEKAYIARSTVQTHLDNIATKIYAQTGGNSGKTKNRLSLLTAYYYTNCCGTYKNN
jgi:DNA-binding NarL/FixJ family response regulator